MNIQKPKVMIIVLNWNSFQDTVECLESLARLDYPDYETVVVDNGSTDNSVQKLKELFPNITLIKNSENLGFAEGNNVGLRYALEREADYVLLLNNDTIVDPNFLEPLVEIAEKDQRVGMVGPKIYYYSQPNLISSVGTKINWILGRATHIGYRKLENGKFEIPRKVDALTAAALLVKTKLIHEIGFLDADFFFNHEDTDWCLRARKAGYDLWIAPKSKIWHKVSIASGGESSPFNTYYSTRNSLLFLRKHNPFWFPQILLKTIWKGWKNILLLMLPGKRESARMVLRGLLDFHLKRFGGRL